MQELKLIALDAQDLAVLSAHLQDAVLKVADIAYLQGEKRFVALANRFDWITALADEKGAGATYTRHRCALRFERVRSARVQGIDLADKQRVLSLLALQFTPASDEDPAGRVTIVFAGDAAIQLDIDYVEAELRDLGAAWAAQSKPNHPDDDGAGGAP